MTEIKDGFPAKYNLLPQPLSKVGRALTWLFSMHQLSPVSEHFRNHPLDPPLESVTDWPVVAGVDWFEAPNQMLSAADAGDQQ